MEEDKFKKIIQWNIGIYFCYSLFNVVAIAHFIEDLAENPEVKIITAFSVFTLSLHTFVNFILWGYYYFQKKHEVAKAYLFSMFLILLIGFPICSSFGRFL